MKPLLSTLLPSLLAVASLETDALAQCPGGPDGTVQSSQKISNTAGSFPGGLLGQDDEFGMSTASIGDLDGDGVEDIAVGASTDDDGGQNRGAVWILFLKRDGTVRSTQKISDTNGGVGGTGFGGTLKDNDLFGLSVDSLGDLNGDGIVDLAVGAGQDDGSGLEAGAVWILFLTSSGTVQGYQKILNPDVRAAGDYFGESVASLGDLDGDHVVDLAVGADQDDDGGSNRGAVWILFLRPDGTVKRPQKISDTQGGFTGGLSNDDRFGGSADSIPDLDGDGVVELAVGAGLDKGLGTQRGAVWILFLTVYGTVKNQQEISETAGGFPGILNDVDNFGVSVESIGDLDLDGAPDLAVGAFKDDDGGTNRGAVWILFLQKPSGTVKGVQKISDTAGNFTGGLNDDDRFGVSVAWIGDLDGNGADELAVGAYLDDNGVFNAGAVWVLFMKGAVPSTEVVRLGTPPNPRALMRGVTSGPVVGSTWDPVVDHTSFQPGSQVDFLGLSPQCTNLPLPSLGTLLIGLPPPGFVFKASPAGSPFSVRIPAKCNLLGLALCAQAVSRDHTGVLELTNALDIAIGTF